MNIKKTVVFILFCLIGFFTNAQTAQDIKDSILRELKLIRKMPVDTSHIIKLRVLGHNLIESDSLLSKQLIEEALEKSLKVKEANTIANCYRILGVWYSYFDNKKMSLECYRKSLQWAKTNKNQYLVAGANLNMGNIKYWTGEYDSCIHFYINAVKIFEDPNILNDKTITEKQLDLRKSDLYSNLSMVFNTLKNLKKADEYIEKAISIAKKYNSPAAAKTLARYMQIKADNYFENGKTKEAINIRLQYLPQLQTGVDLKIYLQGAYHNISREYFALKKIDSAKIFAEKSLSLANEIKSPSSIANANWQLACIAMQEKKYQAAAGYLNLAKGYYLNTEDPLEQRDYFEVMHELKYAEGKFKEAYGYLEKFNGLNDSLLLSKKAEEFSIREIQYQTEKKEAQIKLQQSTIKQKNTLNYILVGSALALLIIILLGYRNYTNRQKLQQQRIGELETEKQLTATEAVLKGEEQERTRLAKDLHDGLGGMLSGLKHSFGHMQGNLVMTPDNALAFNRSMDMLDSSIKEMRRVAHNMMPEALVKFGLDTALKDFCADINHSGALNVDYQSIGMDNVNLENTTAITIFRIVQELLNNTMKHAQAHHAVVQLAKTDQHISITVEDDGRGFNSEALNNADGIGWSNIRNRVEFLKGKWDIKSAPNSGTSVHIEFN